MKNQFDELTKQMAQSVTRRAALKKFGVGLAGMALACFGLANTAKAGTGLDFCKICMSGCLGSGGSHTYCRNVYCVQCATSTTATTSALRSVSYRRRARSAHGGEPG